MTKPTRIHGGRYIGAAALTMLFWSIPLVGYSLLAKLMPDNTEIRQLAFRQAGKNQSLVIALIALLAFASLIHDYRQSIKVEWTLRSSIRIGLFMAGVQWLNAVLLGTHDDLWILRAAMMSLMFIGLLVLTRLIAEEVEKLEVVQRVPETA